MSRSWQHGSTSRWRRTRAAILRANRHENAGRCTLNVGVRCPRHDRPCTGVCTGTADQVHHVRGKAYGDDPRYLVPACAACNGHVGNPTHTVPAPRPVSQW